MRAVQFHPKYCDEAKGTNCGAWDTSHDLSVILDNGERIRVGHFQHADWAQAVGALIEKHGLPGLSK